MRFRKFDIGLGSIVLVAAAALTLELRAPPPAFPEPPAEALLQNGRSNGAATPPLSTAELEARPLFTPTRRPIEAIEATPPAPASPPPLPPPPPPPPPPEASSGLTLLGIVNAPEGRIAIVQIKESGAVKRLTEGESVDRWLVQQILPDHLLLTVADRMQQLAFPPRVDERSNSKDRRQSAPLPNHPPRHP